MSSPLFLLIPLLIGAVTVEGNAAEEKEQGTDRAEFVLHPHKLDAFFHRAATMALLKAKARQTLASVPDQMERIVFRECVRDDAHSPAKYAKCLVKLFRARDRGLEAATETDNNKASGVEQQQQQGIFGGSMSWLAELAKGWVVPKVPQTILLNSSGAGPKQIRKSVMRKPVDEWKRKKWRRKWSHRQPFKWAQRARRAVLRSPMPQQQQEAKQLPKNIGALRALQRHMARLEWAQNYVRGMSQQSARALQPFLSQSINFVPANSAASGLMTQLQAILNSSAATSAGGDFSSSDMSSFSLLSPRLLSLFPSAKGKPRLLSPDLFSFSRDGFLPLPQLLRMVSDESESLQWLDFLLDLTGAGKQLAALLERMRPDMELFERQTWPALQRLRTQEQRWAQLKASMDGRQRTELNKRGFVPLQQWQQEMLFDGGEMSSSNGGGAAKKPGELEAKIEQLAQLADMPEEEVKERIRRAAVDGFDEAAGREEDDEGEAMLDGREGGRGRRIRRSHRRHKHKHHKDDDDDSDDDDDDDDDSDDDSDDDDDDDDDYKKKSFRYLPLNYYTTTSTTEEPAASTSIGSQIVLGNDSNGVQYGVFGGPSPDTEDNITVVPRTVLLTPWAFNNRLGGVILEGVYLSPHAFSTELVSPEVLTMKIASPSAFMAAILSPMALTARIVSPSAFRAQILSPEALSAYVLSPDVFLAQVLSPNVMQAQVLSPKVGFVQVLSPQIAAPRLGSAYVGGLVVMSPNFLSPRIYSRESLMVEILSPHILGGEHEPVEGDHWTPDGSTHHVGSGPVDLGSAIFAG